MRSTIDQLPESHSLVVKYRNLVLETSKRQSEHMTEVTGLKANLNRALDESRGQRKQIKDLEEQLGLAANGEYRSNMKHLLEIEILDEHFV